MAGGSLIGKIHKAFDELHRLGLIDSPQCKIHGAQATGCNPIANAVKKGLDNHIPVKAPRTIAKSLAIGDPADGYFAAKVIRETAGGVTLAVARKLIEQGRIPRDEEIVLCITGNGLKTQDAVAPYLEKPALIRPSLKEFQKLLRGEREPALV